MAEFLRWGQVQRRLTEHLERTGEKANFYDVTRMLWEEGQSVTAEQFPLVSFEQWDVSDPEEFDRLFSLTPVDLSHFHPDFQKNISAARASEPVVVLDVIPFRFAWDQAIGIHRHASFEMVYVMRGEATLECGGAGRVLGKGTLCLLSPNLRHDVVAARGSQVISVMLAGTTLQTALNKLLQQESVLADFFHAGLEGGKTGYMMFHVPEDEPIRKVLRSMFHEHYMRGDYAPQICASYAEIFFAQVLRLCGSMYERHSEDGDRPGAPPMIAILKYIQQNFRTASLGEIAALFHYEPSYLGKHIKATTGKNYTEIVRELRLNEAKRLLKDTDWSMDKIAEQAGYNNQVHFYREFKSGVGETPGAYRRRTGLSGEI